MRRLRRCQIRRLKHRISPWHRSRHAQKKNLTPWKLPGVRSIFFHHRPIQANYGSAGKLDGILALPEVDAGAIDESRNFIRSIGLAFGLLLER